jgi:hypothetical protein
VATVARKLGPNRRALVDDLGAGGYALMAHSLARHVTAKATYDALYEVLTGTTRRECTFLTPTPTPTYTYIYIHTHIHRRMHSAAVR